MHPLLRPRLPFLLAVVFGTSVCAAADQPAPSLQLAALNKYFEQQVTATEGQLDREIKTKEDWLAKKDEYRRQLAEMLGLDPMPPRTDLKPVKTGEFEHEGIVVENLHFQSMPGLYVTANLYRPKVVEKPLPTVLYVCGHASKMKDGVSYGNKAGYEHHGVWYAKHGFVCLVIDTVQLGEIRGEHHGTYKFGRFWWWSRGYTPAGTEAWNGIRALDYLETRPEVDKTRFGVAGRSGGGAYSWWVAALDERIKAAAPTAGITTNRNHIVDGCVEGHCDCMFMQNTYRWDYDKVAALVAPRALCIVNTDKDRIFPIDGVFNVYQKVRRIYKLLDSEKNIGLQVAEGPHADTQPLNVGEFHWMMRFLQGADLMSTINAPAVKSIPMEKLRVFTDLPKDERNTTIDETFVARAPEAKVPEYADDWKKMSAGWMKTLKEKTFGTHADQIAVKVVQRSDIETSESGVEGFSSMEHRYGWVVKNRYGRLFNSSWPHDESGVIGLVPDSLEPTKDDGVQVSRHRVLGVDDFQLDVFLVHRAGLEPKDLELVALHVLDQKGWEEFENTFARRFPERFPRQLMTQPDEEAFEAEKKMHQNFKWGMAYVCPRGIGPTAWDGSADSPVRNPDAKGAEGAKKDEADKSVRAPLTDAKVAAAAEKSRVQRLRRFYLLGQTMEGQQVWDIRCAVRALRSVDGLKDTKLWVTGNRAQAANVLMASLFEDGITRIDLHDLPHSLMPPQPEKGSPVSGDLPAYLNMLKYLDLPQAVAMAAERTRVVIYDNDKAAWSYPQQVSEKLEWGRDKKAGLQLRDVPKPEAKQ
jgi:dienelactone hydrolase